MPESKPSDPARGQASEKARDYSAAWFAAGLALTTAGASLFHHGAGLLLAGVALMCVGIFGAPRRI